MNYSSVLSSVLPVSPAAATIIGIGVIVLMLTAWALIFRKAGEPWWKVLIPGYNVYTQYKIANAPRLFWTTVISAAIYFLLTLFFGWIIPDLESYAIIVLVLSIVFTILFVILFAIFCHSLAQAFDRSGGFAAGLFFLHPVFIVILALSKKQTKWTMKQVEVGDVLLSLKNVDITFGKGDNAVKAVKNASFDILKGETLSLVGESGSGKTTIGRAIIRVNPCAAGEIQYRGVRISGKIPHSLDRQVIRNIQMIFQDPAASLNERATVDYIISEGLYNFKLFENEADRVRKVETMIEEVGLLPEHLTRYPHEFSGGQRQRIGVARAMIMEPELVIADEPISALDVSIRAQVLNLMKKFQREQGITYLFIAHDLSIVRYISDRIAVIYKGDIVEIAETEELFKYPLHPYTRSLISAIPIPDPKLEKHKKLFTYDPSVHDYSTEKPQMTDIGHNHFVYGNSQEIEQYRAQREAETPLKSITFLADGEEDVSSVGTENKAADEEFLKTPIHDTGSRWYAILSFFLIPLGIIGTLLFKRYRHFRNYKMCKKGTISGVCVFGAIILIYCFCLLLSIL